MLEKLRKGATKVLVFGLFAILILSFAVWGIGDMVRTGGQGPVAEVGGTPIQPTAFTAALQQRRQLIGRQFGQPLTPEQSRTLGIDAAVLGELVNGAAISNHARELGLGLSDDTVAELIRSDPAFQGSDNAFSRPLFDERLRQAGYTEGRYIAERRNDEVREQLTEAMMRGIQTPDAVVGIFHRFREEIRRIAFVRLEGGARLKVADPDEKALRTLYDEQKALFTDPERRSIAVMLMTPEALKERAKVTDAEVKAAWEQARPSWDLPERRRIQQISFRTKEEAEGEAKAIQGGKGFLMAALEANGIQGRVDQGLIARREISDQAFAKAAFELPVNQLSPPIQVRGGHLLIRVTEIEPARQRSFEEVQEEVRRGLEDTRIREISSKLHDEVEDKRGASDAADKLKRIADELKLKLIEAKAVDARGLGPDGKPAFDHPEAERFLATAFEGDKLTPREAMQLGDGAEAWVDVIEVKPAAVKPFEDVKPDVEKRWRERETGLALTKEAQALVQRLKGGDTLDAVAKDLSLKVEASEPFKRTAPPAGLTPAAARQAFTLPVGGAGSATSADQAARIVFVVTEIKAAEAATKDQIDAIRRELSSAQQQDAMQSYVTALRLRQGVKVNDAIYKRAIGLDQTP